MKTESYMETSEVKALLDAALPDCEITVDSDGSHYDVTVIGSEFEGVSTLNRQRAINKILMEHITSGTIHAVNIKVFSPAEREKAQKLSISAS
ncbi:MAG: BolA/IbaG family iron-sulfur metabolism protein [Gammaproteobacteria bacterium]|nr:BolA/IbaG family iron-sulfur metabolism protein [Gammaproteobacteria bacterium]MCW8983133.1 BolA/IbaG family iron-sulfur metabolism protein [Gammaproteobacteria bacterium]